MSSLDRISSLAPRGLRNETGQQNCFLNVVVQTVRTQRASAVVARAPSPLTRGARARVAAQLFHVRSFRRALGRIHSSSSLLVTSLQTLYAFYKYSEQSVLPPDEVRVALSALHAQKDGRFALGQQDDANECFEAILMQIHRDACGGSADDDDERVCSPACAAQSSACSFSSADRPLASSASALPSSLSAS